jgi:sulfur-oxidizing protein SoxX
MKFKTAYFFLIGMLVVGYSAADPKRDADFNKMMQSSFRDEGIATVDRLKQDESNAECSKAMGASLPPARAQAIEKAAMETVRPPSDGKYIGDWRAGEKLAQNGRGMTWTDKSAASSANGGNCYNCHQVSKEELSFGTIGPSLYRYGVIRGVTDPESPSSKAIVEYTWSKLYNSKATNACSGMPRFGHGGLLNEAQMKDLMALLLDPQSVANR